MHGHKRLTDAYRFSGFSPKQEVVGLFVSLAPGKQLKKKD